MIGHHTQTQDRYDSTVNTDSLVWKYLCAKCIFRYYKRIINCNIIFGSKNIYQINSTVRRICFFLIHILLGKQCLKRKTKANNITNKLGINNTLNYKHSPDQSQKF